MSNDYGRDLGGAFAIDDSLKLIAGPQVLFESIARGLMTPQGSLVDAPDWGVDIRKFLHSPMTLLTLMQIKSLVLGHLLHDERVGDCSVDVTSTGPLHSKIITIRIHGELAEGPFKLVLSADKVNVKILESA